MAITIQDYSALREVQSLDNVIKSHLDKIKAENDRTSHVKKLREQRSQKKEDSKIILGEQKEKLITQEKELFTLEAKLEQTKNNLSQAASASQMQALEDQLKSTQEEIDLKQDLILELMDAIESTEGHIQEDDQFLAGSLETLQEIQAEVDLLTSEDQKQIKLTEERIAFIFEPLAKELVVAFEQARERHRFNNPITKIKGNSCQQCRFILDAQTSSQVELCRAIEFCGQCYRLIAPIEA